jgi:hypothetical protein
MEWKMSGKTARNELSTEHIAQLRVAHTEGSYCAHVYEYDRHVDSGPVLCKTARMDLVQRLRTNMGSSVPLSQLTFSPVEFRLSVYC